MPVLHDREFRELSGLMLDIAGVYLAPAKRNMVAGRLVKRLRARQLSSWRDYCSLIRSPAEGHELQRAVDLLTTNETYFFREPRHFQFLEQEILPGRRRGGPFRVWSAACSSGEEPYSIAMTLADQLGEREGWEVVGSDISATVLERARTGIYPLARSDLMPSLYKHRFCRKGVGEQEGKFLVGRQLRDRVTFGQINLNEPLPGSLGRFDLILLRNVMIYFPVETKRDVVARVTRQLQPGGYLLIGHSESLHGFQAGLELVRPSIYRNPL